MIVCHRCLLRITKTFKVYEGIRNLSQTYTNSQNYRNQNNNEDRNIFKDYKDFKSFNLTHDGLIVPTNIDEYEDFSGLDADESDSDPDLNLDSVNLDLNSSLFRIHNGSHINENMPKAKAKSVSYIYSTYFQKALYHRRRDIQTPEFDYYDMVPLKKQSRSRLPKFPKELKQRTIREYLRLLVCHDFGLASSWGFVVHRLIKSIIGKLVALDYILDIQCLQYLVRYLSRINDWKTVFYCINKFEEIGIKPDSICFNWLLKGVSVMERSVRKYSVTVKILKLGLNHWKIVPDNTTITLMYLIMTPSRERWAVGRALFDHGIDVKNIKWNLCDDAYAFLRFKGEKPDLLIIKNWLINRNVVRDNAEDERKLFHRMVSMSLNDNDINCAIELIVNNEKLCGIDTCESLVNYFIARKNITNAIAARNWFVKTIHESLIKNEKQFLFKVNRIILLSFKTIYEEFSKQKKGEEKFAKVIRVLFHDCDLNKEGVSKNIVDENSIEVIQFFLGKKQISLDLQEPLRQDEVLLKEVLESIHWIDPDCIKSFKEIGI